MEKLYFIGYIDNQAATNLYLQPLYTYDGKKYFLPQQFNSLEKLVDISPEKYRFDNICILPKESWLRIDKEAIIVLKTNKDITYSSYSVIKNYVLSLLKNKKINGALEKSTRDLFKVTI